MIIPPRTDLYGRHSARRRDFLMHVRSMALIDIEQVQRLSKRVLGRSPDDNTIAKAVKLTGRVGLTTGLNDEKGIGVITGFLIAHVDPESIIVDWLVVHPDFRSESILGLCVELRKLWKHTTLTFRLLREDYETMAVLKNIFDELVLEPTNEKDSPWVRYSV